MNEISIEKIQSLLRECNVMSMATCDNNIPWAASVFFVADDAFNLYFVSSASSRHSLNVAQATRYSQGRMGYSASNGYLLVGHLESCLPGPSPPTSLLIELDMPVGLRRCLVGHQRSGTQCRTIHAPRSPGGAEQDQAHLLRP
jgi:hypothetical protein